MVNKYNKADLKDFDKLVEQFDEYTDKYDKLELNEIKIKNNRTWFNFLIKSNSSMDIDMLEGFVRTYYKHQHNLCVEILNENCLSYTIVGFD